MKEGPPELFTDDEKNEEGELVRFVKGLPSLSVKVHAAIYGAVVAGLTVVDVLIFKKPLVSLIVAWWWGMLLGGHYIFYRYVTRKGRERRKLAREDVKRFRKELARARFRDPSIQNHLKEVRKLSPEHQAAAARAVAIRADILDLVDAMDQFERTSLAEVLERTDEACSLIFQQLRRASQVETQLKRHDFNKFSKEIERAEKAAVRAEDPEAAKHHRESALQLRAQWERLAEVARLRRRLMIGAEDGVRLLMGIHVDLTRLAATSEGPEGFARTAGALEQDFSRRLQEIGAEASRAVESVEEVRRITGAAASSRQV